MTETPASPIRRPSLGRRIFRIVRDLLAVVGLFYLIFHLCFDVNIVVSNSMAPTLRGDGRAGSDWLLVEKMTYRFRRPRRWELVQFRNSEGLVVTKRVVGLPGEKVSVRDHQVAIDGQPILPPPSLSFLRYYAYGNLRNGQSVDCGDAYFVLGDASDDSADSRYEGPIPLDRISARGWLVIRPMSRFRFVTP